MAKEKIQSIIVDGVTYIREDSIKSNEPAEKLNGLKYCIVRTYSAGVFAGYLKEQNGKEGLVLQARRLHYWDGAASLSQLSQEGVTKPENCRFPVAMPEVSLTEIIEVIPCTEAARLNIAAVQIWKM